jgi:hypothetical protein
MNRPSIGLKKTQETEIDERLEDAIWIKNTEIRNIKAGIVAVDRAPLDFIAFPAKPTETLGVTARKRSRSVLERLEGNKLRDICEGQVLVVQADPEVLVERQLQRGGRTTPEEVASGATARYLERQKDRLAQVYRKAISEGSAVETDRCTVAISVKAAARIIHFGEYLPFDFANRLRVIQKNKK